VSAARECPRYQARLKEVCKWGSAAPPTEGPCAPPRRPRRSPWTPRLAFKLLSIDHIRWIWWLKQRGVKGTERECVIIMVYNNYRACVVWLGALSALPFSALLPSEPPPADSTSPDTAAVVRVLEESSDGPEGGDSSMRLR